MKVVTTAERTEAHPSSYHFSYVNSGHARQKIFSSGSAHPDSQDGTSVASGAGQRFLTSS